MEDQAKFKKLILDNIPHQLNSHEQIRQTNMGQTH